MSLELVNTFATLGTFLVIAMTAIAAIIQLRHLRSSNQIVAFNELRESFQTDEFATAARIIATELPKVIDDPAFRYEIQHPETRTVETHALLTKVRMVGNFYESLGILVRTGLVDRDTVLEFWGAILPGAWKRIAPVTAIYRRRQGPAVYENFEYITVLAQEWRAKHRNGTYPPGMRRIELKDDWLEVDQSNL
ncbi:MAG: hypothetical protein WA629_02540 [Candidatus Aquilonibacter sp.]